MKRSATIDHRLERMTFFSDAVFAISITLLILELRVPEGLGLATNQRWLEVLAELVWRFNAFLLSFLVIGALWVSHHMLFSLLHNFNRRILWPNLLLLLTVTVIPFTTTLLAKGSLSPIPYAAYSAVLLAAGLFKVHLTRFALMPELVSSGVRPGRIALELRRRWILPLAALAGLILAFPFPAWNNLAMLILPIGLRLPGLRYTVDDQ